MKKNLYGITALLFLLISTNSMAQYEKGGKFVEGNIGNIYYSKANNTSESSGSTGKSDSKTFSLDIFPRMGFFIADNFAVGAELDIYVYNYKSESFYATTGGKSTDAKQGRVNLGFGPFARYYFAGSSDNKSKFYGQVGGGVNADLSTTNETTNYNLAGGFAGSYKYDYKKKYNSLYGNAAIGWNRYLAGNLALNVNLGYRYSHSTYTYNSVTVASSGITTTSPDLKSTSNTNSVTWNIGFIMFFPSGVQHHKK